MVRFPRYYELVVIPKLITSNAIEDKTPGEACLVIKKRIGVQKRQAQKILAWLEKNGYISKTPAQLPRIHIIKRNATSE